MLAPERVSFDTASLPNLSLPETLALGQALGFHGVELLTFDGYRHRTGELVGFYWECLSPAARDELVSLLSPFAAIALHAPFIDIHPLAPSPAVRAASVGQLEVAVEAGLALQAEVVTTHAIPTVSFAYEELKGSFVDLYRRLGDLAAAGPGSLKIGLETGWPSAEQLVELVAAIDHPRVGITLDVGHLVGELTAAQRAGEAGPVIYNEVLRRHLRTAAPWLCHVHLHNIRYPAWRDHGRLGTGVIDIPAFINELSRLGYEGMLSFELEETDAPEALRESREVLIRLIEANNDSSTLTTDKRQ